MKIGALVGGAIGVAAAAAATAGAVAYERRTVGRERARITPASAARFGALPVDRQQRVRTDDGVELHVEEAGPRAAPLTVLFVHGFTLALGSFHFQRIALNEAFGDQVRMVFYDQRSHGRSARAPHGGSTLEQLGRDLYTVLDALVPAGPVVLVGHSMGGMTVMALADQHPELFDADGRVQAVALVNTSSGDLKNLTLGLPSALARLHGPVLPVILRRAARNAALVEKGRALGKDLAWTITKKLSFGSADVDPAVVAYATAMIAATPVDVVAEFYATLVAHDGTAGLQNLRELPVLVVGADHDALTPLEHARTIARVLPDAELVVAGASGHLLMLERPEVVNRPLVELVSGVLAQLRPARRRQA